jgi:hypothetical protein
MKYRTSFTRISHNVKTGPIPVTMTDKSTCPNACPLKGSGCYAELGNVNIHWNRLGKPYKQATSYGLDWQTLCDNVKALPKGQLWRHSVAGDLPTLDADNIDSLALAMLVNANKGKKGFTYTHHNPETGNNAELIKAANKDGFTVNLSANTLQHADKLKALNIGPVVCILPIDAAQTTITPAGNSVVICPAVQSDNVNCASCGICQKADRKVIIGFPVHGTSKRKAESVFKGIPIAKANK